MNTSVFTILMCSVVLALSPATAADAPFTSTRALNLDTITDAVSSTFRCLEFNGRKNHQVYDKRIVSESMIYAYSFNAVFSDQQPIEIVVNPEFESTMAARRSVYPVAYAMGRVYPPLRSGVGRIVLHKGNEGLHAGGYIKDYGQVVLYSGTVADRLKSNHLEESLFHESVHAAWDRKYRNTDQWIAAQKADDAFITKYAAKNPSEDLAETALLVYGLKTNPKQIPSNVSDGLAVLVPNRTKIILSIMDYEERLLLNSDALENAAQCEQ